LARVIAGKTDTTWLSPGAVWVMIFLIDGIKWKILCDCPIAPNLWSDPKNLILNGHRYEGSLIWRRAWERVESQGLAVTRIGNERD
jgi:hypothetical protein